MKKRTRGWTTEQILTLNDICESGTYMTASEMSELVGKSSRSIYNKMSELGLKKPSINWTESEDNYLIENFCNRDISVEAISLELKRTVRAVNSRARTLNLRRVHSTDEFDEYLIKNYNDKNKSIKDIALLFDKPLSTVYRRASELGISNRNEFSKTSCKQYFEVLKRYPTTPTVRLSAELNLPEYTVRRIAYKNKLKKKAIAKKPKLKASKSRHVWTEQEEEFVLCNHSKMTAKTISLSLNIDYHSVRMKIRHMGLSDTNLKIYSKGTIRFTYNTSSEKINKLEYIRTYSNLINQGGLIGV